MILAAIDLEINAGESVAVVGASGSGKTTLLGILAGLDTPTSGTVALDGHELTQLSEEQRARVRGELVGFVFQSFQLLGSLTALENVMLPGELRGDADPRRDAMELLRRTWGLSERREPLSAPAVGRRAATRRDRARVCVAAESAVRRRTDRQSRHRHRRADHRSAVRTERRICDDAGARHARRAARRSVRPRDRTRRRPHRRGGSRLGRL